VLGRSGPVATANSFGLGGDSLKAMQMIVKLRAAGVWADVTQLYEAQTLGGFTELVKGGDEADKLKSPSPDGK
jgi:aryl carrier-like protein